MTSYRYLGYGTTDSNGVAHLQYDSEGHEITPNGYHGTGAGEVDVIASLDKPITSSSIVSEPYNVWDTYKWDTGTISSHNDIWNYNDATTVLTRYDEYSSITEKVSGTDARLYCKNLPTSATIDIELCQIDGGIGNGGLNFYDNESYRAYFNLQDLGYTSSTIGQWVRLRVTYGNGSLTATSLDDPTKTVTKSYNNNITSFSPSTNSAITEHRFRNMKVYSI